MRPLLLFLFVLAACTVVVVAVPHHQRQKESFRPCTLGGIYLDLFREIPKHLDERVVAFLLLAFAGLLGAFYPALLVAMIAWLHPAGGNARGWFIAGGVLAGVGAAANFLAILLSHMSFGFGVSADKTQTPFAWIIPLAQGCCAAGSVVIGLSGACANQVQRWITAS